MSAYDPSKGKSSNPLLSASLQVDDFAARIMPAAPPPPPPVIAEVKPVVYGTTPVELGLSTSSSTTSLVREEAFSDISLAPSTMPSAFVGSDTPLQMPSMNPLEDLEPFGGLQGGVGGGVANSSQGYDGGYSAAGEGNNSFGGGNTATEMLINQASSITANFQQALPAVASTVFSHFSNYLKGGQPHSHQSKVAHEQQHHYQPQQQQPSGFDGGVINQPAPYVSPLDDIYHQQMSNPTESVNQMPLFISPQDAPSPGLAQGPPAAGGGAQNTYRIGGQKKKTYAPPPVQGFTSQAPGNFIPGYDPTMPIQSSAPSMPPLPPPIGGQQVVGGAETAPQRPPSVPQPPQQESVSSVPQEPSLFHSTITPTTSPPPSVATPSMFMPPDVSSFPNQPPTPQQQQPFFQPPAANPQPEPEKSKFSISSFFTSNPILDRLQGKSPTPQHNQQPEYQSGQEQQGYGMDFMGGIATGHQPQMQTPSQPATVQPINPQMFNTNPIQSPSMIPPPMTGNSGTESAMGFFNPPPQTSAMPPMTPSSGAIGFNPLQAPSAAAGQGFNPPPLQPMMPSDAATSPAPPSMHEPPKALGGSAGGYRMNRSRPAYANPNLIAQSHATSGFMPAVSPGQVPPVGQWFNPAGGVPQSVPDVAQIGGGVQQSQETIPGANVPPPMASFFTPDVTTTTAQATPLQPPQFSNANIPTIPPMQVPSVTPQPMIFNPMAHQQQQVRVTSSTPDLIVPQVSQGQGNDSILINPVEEKENVATVIPGSEFNPTEPVLADQQVNLTKTPPPTPVCEEVKQEFNPQSFFNPVESALKEETKKEMESAIPEVKEFPAPVPTAAFFDNAFSQMRISTPAAIQSNAAGQQEPVAMFQPVNFFNTFNNNTQPTGGSAAATDSQMNAPIASFPPPPPMAMAFEPAAQQLDSNANVKSTSETMTESAGEVPSNLWSDDNANFIVPSAAPATAPPQEEISAILPTDSFLEASTTAVRDEQSQDDFLSSFERTGSGVDDLNSKFFDSPPEVQPTDPIANPNFFKSFMKAKFTANAFGEDFNDQSLVVEPPSIDDSSVSCASFPSFDQSSAQLGTMTTDGGFQVNQPTFDEFGAIMSRMSTSPSMPLPEDMDGVPIVTRSRTGSMSSQVSSSRPAVATGPYRPVYKHWFYSYKDGSDKIKWAPMSMRDSLAVETAFVDPCYDTSKLISTDGGRHDVDIKERKRMAVYWQAETNEVRRCSWFYKTIDCSFVPFEEDMAELLEAEYKDAHESKQWQRKITLPNGEIVQIHDTNLMMHYISTSTEGSWGQTSTNTTVKRVVKRGVDEFNIEDGEPDKIDHVLFMVHGIGAACDLKFRSVEEVVDEFRSIAHQMVQSHYRSSYDSGEIGRIEVLPISWHSELHSEESGIDAKLKAITLESIPKIRSLANETILDVLFYTSPKFCQHIIDIVSGSLNKLYSLFCQRNPQFAGGISLAGHSLGSLILFDLLTHQKAEPENRENLVAKEGGATGNPATAESHVVPTNYMIGHEGTTGQPCISYPQLLFTVSNFFALGSPIGMFVTVRGIDTLGLDFKLPTCERFFNIFHPFDPVAYRIESLVNGECSSLQPVLIPHHKGRKRMHLELRETMERVKGDLKARLINTFKSTLDTVTHFKGFNRTDTSSIASEVDKVLDQQLQMNGGAAAAAGTSSDSPNTAATSEVDPGETDLSLGRLNQGQRIDYVLQEAPLEFFNGYLFALTSHVCYWESEDTTLFVVKEIYSSMGVRTDSKVPQHSLTIERPTTN